MKASAVLLVSLSASLLLAGCTTPAPGTVITTFDCEKTVPIGSIITGPSMPSGDATDLIQGAPKQ